MQNQTNAKSLNIIYTEQSTHPDASKIKYEIIITKVRVTEMTVTLILVYTGLKPI